MNFLLSILYAACTVSAAALPATTTSSVDLFPTNIGFLGVTATSEAPFLAQTDRAAITYGTPTSSYTLPQPIETAIQAKDSAPGDRNIFELMGTISPYYVGEGWGIYDYGMPEQCSIKQVHVLARHGSRYPTHKMSTGTLLSDHNYTATGELEFLNGYEYVQGVNVLTKLGNQQLFDKGVRTFFRYGDLYQSWGANNTTPHKMVARTTSQERITATAEYFLAGFFGLDWQNYADLEIIIESNGYNNTMASDSCPISNNLTASDPDTTKFKKQYLANAVERFNANLTGLTLTTDIVFDMQQLCTYEVNNNGFSPFCSLFTQQEWEDYEYLFSWNWYNDNMFGSPVGRALGVGWVEEFKQRLLGSNEFDWSTLASQNTTLDANPTYFPTNQSLYFDFSHDSDISNIFTALGMNQFKSNFTIDGKLGSKEQPLDASTVVPFASQTYFEVIECSAAIPANRSIISEYDVNTTETTKYIHMILNDHTINLSENFPDFCEPRDDGWCEFSKFMDHLDTLYELSDFDNACYTGDYDLNAFVTDGHP
ncbi:acid phosphatase [Saccharomycopsis crataegensis]|uniref:Acid phosphatase n=1 Tax=Saccharomycopsis crataegensis TaxID=43959 RepID=A0AAV5QJQ1_9ASCO|nr:acid phosphatase [Saccharomycopsis crataegensis]